jgi:RHH-type rel operon transcriptional repressor/antitoxin RelB
MCRGALLRKGAGCEGPARHCERSEAIQKAATGWIASSQELLAMTTGRIARRPMLYMHGNRSSAMLALRLPPEIERRLDALAKRTGRSKSYYAREAILRHIEDIEDAYLARHRRRRGGSQVTLKSLERDFAGRSKT